MQGLADKAKKGGLIVAALAIAGVVFDPNDQGGWAGRILQSNTQQEQEQGNGDQGNDGGDQSGDLPDGGSPDANRKLGKQMAANVGWTGDQWSCLEKLWTNESGWKHKVWNYQGSGAYGIPQALPADKMASAGSDYKTNPQTQIKWGLGYIDDRYGTPCDALSFWRSQNPHWY